MVSAILSIFHGSKVESTFSVMDNVVDPSSGRMNMETYSAVQDIKYALKSRAPNEDNKSVRMFHRNDRLFSPVDPTLSNSMGNSYKTYKKTNKEKKDEKEKRKRKYKVMTDETTAKKLKMDAVALADEAQTAHEIILKKAYKPSSTWPLSGPVGENVNAADECSIVQCGSSSMSSNLSGEERSKNEKATKVAAPS